MNKVLKMDFKRQTAVLAAFVLVGMMFLVPAVIEKAQALIRATATGTCGPEGQTQPCEFTLLGKELKKGVFSVQPSESGTSVKWVTKGNNYAIPSDEEGAVIYKVEGGGAQATLFLWFKNPLVGINDCKIFSNMGENSDWRSSSCTAGEGSNADFTYNLRVR